MQTGMQKHTLKSGAWSELQAEAAAVRYAVFVEEQQVPLSMEMDSQDSSSLHVVAFDGCLPIGTGRLLSNAHIGRMAVLANYRGQGVGALILQKLMAMAYKRGERAVYLSAQLHALDFYARYGFEPYGDIYQDANIAHRMMRYAFSF